MERLGKSVGEKDEIVNKIRNPQIVVACMVVTFFGVDV